MLIKEKFKPASKPFYPVIDHLTYLRGRGSFFRFSRCMNNRLRNPRKLVHKGA